VTTARAQDSAAGVGADGPTEPAQVAGRVPPRLSVPKASDVLADELRQRIFSGEFKEGEVLPVERVLSSDTGLSRGTVREALRALELEGLVHTRPGRAGGSFVRRPDTSTFERSLNILVGGQGVHFGALVEAREAIEPAAAGLAAKHRTDADLANLRAAADHMRDTVTQVHLFKEHNVTWHVAVVEATHNEIMQAYVGSLWKTISRGIDVATLYSPRTLQETLAAHERIFQAIEAGDQTRAYAAMAKHAVAYRDEISRHHQFGNQPA
jgi:GntR family transcriptional repressor for pyruvate dehydrogenase complex